MIGKYMLAISMPGILFCYDTETGRELWKERLDANYSSTPLVAEGHAYFQNDAGQTTVIEPGDEIKVVAKGALKSDGDELFRAVPVPSGGELVDPFDAILVLPRKKGGRRGGIGYYPPSRVVRIIKACRFAAGLHG